MNNKVIFLDRDGVINDEKRYVKSVEDFRFISGSIEALKRLSDSEYKLIIITNQGGIGHKFYTEEDYMQITKYMLDELKQNNVEISEVYYCKHDVEENCECRKPKQGMIEKAKEKYDIDFKNSYLIGDKTSDIKLGIDIGCKTILVKTGFGGSDERYKVNPTYVANNLFEATKLILK